jgi:hypothetical protein
METKLRKEMTIPVTFNSTMGVASYEIDYC